MIVGCYQGFSSFMLHVKLMPRLRVGGRVAPPKKSPLEGLSDVVQCKNYDFPKIFPLLNCLLTVFPRASLSYGFPYMQIVIVRSKACALHRKILCIAREVRAWSRVPSCTLRSDLPLLSERSTPALALCIWSVCVGFSMPGLPCLVLAL